VAYTELPIIHFSSAVRYAGIPEGLQKLESLRWTGGYESTEFAVEFGTEVEE
jgi:hypothetical protein